MPVQTTSTGDIFFPDGAKAEVKASGDASWTDLGALNSAINVTLNYEENTVNTANAGQLATSIRNMTVDAGFTLINLNQTAIEKLGGGMFTNVTEDGSSVSSIDDQVIASGGATNVTPYPLVIVETGGESLKVSSSLVVASVTGATDGALTANVDFTIIDDANSYSGKSILFNTAGANLTTMAQEITIAYTSVTPVANTATYVGSSTIELAQVQLRFTHTDDNSLTRQVELFNVALNSGGIQFNFKGANEDGVEEMPLTFTGKLDTTLTSGRQLLRWAVDAGAA